MRTDPLDPIAVVFLDIDGVLNGGWCKEFEFDWTKPEAVAAFNRIMAETGARVVVSSSWRLENSLNDIKAFLFDHGIDSTIEFIGVTPEIDFEVEWHGDLLELPDARIKEIRAWLNQHPEVQHFVVLDDQDIRLDVNNDVKSDSEIESRWVRTIYEEGLTEEQADTAVRIMARSR